VYTKGTLTSYTPVFLWKEGSPQSARILANTP
jgi:hypothetical protein